MNRCWLDPCDADPIDVLRAMRGAWLVTDEPHRRDYAGRLLDLLMDGLRYGATTPASHEA